MGIIDSKSPSFDGHLGIRFKNGIKYEPLIDFESFPNCNFQEMADEYVKSMNHDYQTLYRLCVAVKTGIVSEELANLTLGKCHQAR